MSSPRGDIAFVVPHPYVDALACFREPILAFADRGYRVDLFTTLSPLHPAPFFGRPTVRIRPFEISRSGAVSLVAALLGHRPKYRWIVTVPQWGLHYAGQAASLAGIPMACISDELFPSDDATTAVAKRWKARERAAHRRCRWTIALSEERASFIRSDNGLDAGHPIFVVPNAPSGTAHRLRSHYYQDTLQLDPDTKVILHAGSFWWQAAKDLMSASDAWPDRSWTLVFQGRFAQDVARPASPSVRLASAVLPASLLDYAVSSATIGLALYDTSSIRQRLMGTASGKICLYLKNRLPVIALAGPSFSFLERERCGVCVDGVADVPAAAARITADYDRYADAAARFFDDSLEFHRRFEPVLDAVSH